MASKYPKMNWVGENIADNFKIFKQQMTLILIDENVVEPAKQAIKLQIAVGTEGLQRLNASTLTDEEKQDPAKIYKLFDDKLNIKVNFRIHRVDDVVRFMTRLYFAKDHNIPAIFDPAATNLQFSDWTKWCR